jgi:hypothetical protein
MKFKVKILKMKDDKRVITAFQIAKTAKNKK